MTEFTPEVQGPTAYPDSSQAVGGPESAPGVEEPGATGSWLLAAASALVVGAIAAFAYAAISFAMQREFLMLVIGVGLLVGVTVAMVAKRTGFVTGVIAVLIAAVAVLAADALMVVFFAAGSIPTGLSRLANVDVGTVISAYFEDPLGYLWLAVALIAAFSAGSGMGDKKDS
ncbi:hypothetical protein [Demequina sp.]|uniref:hypothetical protein n=1 Tax=Demequina sp. TaxID=2050685 RepID=UPI0025BB18F7|nr:hypothetical protein [Demequina sp.]